MQKETIGQCTLYLGDCLEVMPTIETADLIVTDPPYDLSSSGPGKSHFGMSLSKFDSGAYTDLVNGFDVEQVFSSLEELCLPFNMFCFCSNKPISKIMAYHEGRGRIVTLLVWHKNNSPPFANGVWRGDIEYIVHARDSGAFFEGAAMQKKKVFTCPSVKDHIHPTVKPTEIIKKYIKIGSAGGQLILDPFMGSGTTGVACAVLGRKFIGIEINEQYFDIACKRIEQAYAQPDLFVEHPVRPEQTAMEELA